MPPTPRHYQQVSLPLATPRQTATHSLDAVRQALAAADQPRSPRDRHPLDRLAAELALVATRRGRIPHPKQQASSSP